MTQNTQNDAKNAKLGLKNAKYANFGLKNAKFGPKNAKYLIQFAIKLGIVHFLLRAFLTQ